LENQPISIHIIGSSFALSAAVLWAGASILWKKLGKDVSALGMNLGKGLVSLIFLILLFLFTSFPGMSLNSWILLGLSGLIGIALGDTAYFLALIRLGPRKILVLTTLTPLLASLIAILFLGEKPTVQWGLGAALCLGGVVWVMKERLPKGQDMGSWKRGIWLGLLAVFCEAGGIILTKLGLINTEPGSWRDATFIRLLFGVGGLFCYGMLKGQIGDWLKPFKSPALFGVLIIASFMGTFLAILFATASLWYTHVTIVSILKSMSPIFVLPMAYFILKEKVSFQAVLGAIIAVAGVAILITK